MKKPILFIDMDGVLCNFTKASCQAKLDNSLQLFPQAQWGFFLRLEEMPDAINSIKILEKKYDVWILTRPSFPNVNSFTEKAQWIWDHIGYYMVEKIIMSGDKSKVGEVGDFLIDDMNTDKQSEFKGEWIEFGSSKFPNWESVVDYLMTDV